MALKIGNGLDLQRTQLYNAVLQVLSSFGTGIEGQIGYDSTIKSPGYHNGTAWVYLDVSKVADGYIPIGKLSVNPLARANHTGTQAWGTLTGTPTTLGGYGITDAVPSTRTVATSAPLTGGGDLSANRTIGISAATTSAAGSMSGADKAKLDGIATGATANQTDAFLRARANHTGTQTAATISDFDTAVRTSRLDQMSAPTVAVSLNSQKLTSVAAGTAATDAVNKGQMDTAIQQAASGIDPKESVKAATTANITLSGAQTIDGTSVVVGDRVLVKNQTTASANGIYVVASGAWTRSVDASAGTLTSGALVLCVAGTQNAGTQWYLNTPDPIVVGTTALTFVQFGAGASYGAGNGLSLTGSTFAAVPKPGSGITVDAAGIGLSADVPKKYSQTFGDGSATSFTITHNLNTQDVSVTIREAANPASVIITDVGCPTVNTVVLTFNAAPTSNQYRVTVMG